MKKIMLTLCLSALIMVSCNQKNKEVKEVEGQEIAKTDVTYSCPMHPEVTGKKGDVCSKCGMDLEPEKISEQDTKVEITEVNDAVKASVSTDAIINAYLKIKNALTSDNSSETTAASNDFIKAVVATSTSKMDSKLLTKYLNSTDDAKIQAELIAKNDGKIDQQRKYFSLLSKDIATLIATCGSSKHLYQDYCPMYNEGRSGYWISEMKEIKNPYFGSEMMECGGMIKEIE